MATECWWRNPYNYVRELVEVGQSWVAWDRGLLVKRQIDPTRFSEQYLSAFPNRRALLIGEQGSTEINARHPDWKTSPILYPTWEYGLFPLRELHEWIAVNQNPAQEHRVLIIRPPDMDTRDGKNFVIHLQELQEDYPETIIHLHGLDSFRVMFGRGFASVDIDPRTTAKGGQVRLANGNKVPADQAAFYFPKWVEVANMRAADLSVARNRCIFNIRSALWAASNWDADGDWTKKGYERPELPDDYFDGVTIRRRVRVTAKPHQGDMVTCRECSLQAKCTMYREGSMCRVPGSTGNQIAKYFDTNDPEQALRGLSKIIEIDADRVQRALELEDQNQDEKPDPDTTKMIDGLWKKGREYTTLLQPKTPLVAIQNNNGSAPAQLTEDAGPNELISAATARLEAAGWPRQQITMELITEVLEENTVRKYTQELPAAVEDANVVD